MNVFCTFVPPSAVLPSFSFHGSNQSAGDQRPQNQHSHPGGRNTGEWPPCRCITGNLRSIRMGFKSVVKDIDVNTCNYLLAIFVAWIVQLFLLLLLHRHLALFHITQRPLNDRYAIVDLLQIDTHTFDTS